MARSNETFRTHFQVCLQLPGELGDLVDGKHSGRVIDENKANILFAHPTSPHSRYNPSEDVIVTVSTVSL